MDNSLRAVLVCASDDSARALAERLDGSFDLTWQRVGRSEELASLFARTRWDVVIADLHDPTEDTPALAGAISAHAPDLPLIVVSGTKGEEAAVRTMRAGARAYILRSELERLQTEVGRELAVSRSRRRTRQAEIRERSQLLDAFFEHSITPMVFLDRRFNFIRVNEAYARSCGRQPSDFPGRNHFELYPDAGNQRIFEEVVRSRRPFQVLAKPFVFQDHPEWGVTYWDWTLVPILDSSGEVEFLVFSLEDVTAQVRAQDELRKSEQRYRRLIENLRDEFIFYAHGTDGVFTYVSPSVKGLLGFAPEELLTMRDSHLPDTPLNREARRRAELAISGQQQPSYEVEVLHKDGSARRLAINESPVLDTDGRVIAVEGVARDVTERLRAEEERAALQAQLVQAQKMEAIGRLAGGVAHDFNNMMTAVTGHARRLLRRLDKDDPTRRGVEEILKGGERATLLTRQLLAFSRKQIFRLESLDLNEVLGGMASMLRRLLGENIELLFRPAQDLEPVRADRAQLEQAVVNLALNSRDAMPEGGRLTVTTANVRLEDREELARLDLPADDYVMVAIEDTGHGMDATAQSHVFEPFFTTKSPGEGTGLGLSTVYGIVKQSGGGIVFASQPGRGTTFRVYLPRAATPLRVPRTSQSSDATRSPRGGETVLLVEDEDLVRKLVTLELEDAGYRVLQAETPGRALALAQRHQDRIDVLLSDVVLPGMSGPRLFEALAPLRPEARVLYISGHTEKHIVRHGALTPGTAFLEKPFTPEALLAKIREVLDGC